jgi:hypothetical protein
MFSLPSWPSNRKWITVANHRAWLLREAEALFLFFERGIINRIGGFLDLDDEGRTTAPGYGSAEKPASICLQPQESFTPTRLLISWVDQVLTL